MYYRKLIFNRHVSVAFASIIKTLQKKTDKT